MITHHHVDHLGLIEIIVEHSGAEVAAIGAAAVRLADFEDETELDDEFAAALMLRNGIPEECAALRRLPSFRGWGGPVDVTRPLPTASPLSSATARLEVLLRRATARRTRVFWDAERRDPDRRRPPHPPYLLQPAHLAAARRLARPHPVAGHLHRVVREDPRAAGRDPPPRPRRPDRRPPGADRRPPRLDRRRKEKIFG